MEFLIVILFALLAAAVKSQKGSPYTPIYISNGSRRVIDGKQATKSQFPYQAGIIFTPIGELADTEITLGGGCLISSTRVLTAAHNVVGVSSGLVILGAIYLFKNEPNQVSFDVPVSQMVCHPRFNLHTKDNDIAMIKLPSAVKFNNYISPIALPEGSNDYVGVTGVISGWGEFDETKEQSQYLRFANMKVITNSKCNEDYGDIIHSIICTQSTGDNGGCNGDSG